MAGDREGASVGPADRRRGLVPASAGAAPLLSWVHLAEPGSGGLADAAAWERALVGQESGQWELVVVDRYGRTGQGSDPRVTWLTVAEDTAEGAALGLGVAASCGTYVGEALPGDQPRPEAVGSLAAGLAASPRAGAVYCDERIADSAGGRDWRKPAFDGLALLGRDLFGGFALYDRELLETVGWTRPGIGRSWDLALRATESGCVVVHLPEVLVTRTRALLISDEEAVAIVSAALARRGINAQAEPAGRPGLVHVSPRVVDDPQVSIVIPTAGRAAEGEDEELVLRAVGSLVERTSARRLELVVVISEGAPDGLEDRIRSAARGVPLVVEHRAGPFNYAETMNRGVALAHGDFVLLLNDDTEVTGPEWLDRMLGWAQQPDVGGVGALLMFPDGRVQHAGVFHLPGGGPYHLHMFDDPEAGDYFGSLSVPAQYVAVTGACTLLRRSAFIEAGGYDPAFALNFNDIDLCLRLATIGLSTVFEPWAKLIHRESATREAVVLPAELDLYVTRWAERIGRDRHVAWALIGRNPVTG